ncbi:MAG TPA: Gfo/Idh/MocA family oxidoreductase, partial [Isosphaeraceae bacterium]|nr:Gfo/Idh/MocA family oxidoreductase [Isosphaeraceae bacterium]
MAKTRGPVLGLGIIGLGRLWEARHKPALSRLKDRFRVVAVYDQVGRRADIEARQVGCSVADGLTELVQRPDVDAIYLLTPQWFGLHPISLAIDAGKAVYCALPAATDPDGLEALAGRIRARGLVYMPELPRRFYPATRRLLELLQGPLGPARLVQGHARFFGFDRYDDPGPSTQLAPSSLKIDPGGNLIDWCRRVF